LTLALVSGAIASPKPFNIDAQEAPRSLLEFGRQSAVQILFASEKVKDIITNAVHGNYEPIDALRLLLKGTPLIVSERSDGVLVVEPQGNAQGVMNSAPVPSGDTGNPTRIAQSNTTGFQSHSSDSPKNTNAPDSKSNETERIKLEEIVVTATRREESGERVPISIKALSQNDLTQGGIKDITDIAAVTPGLQYTANAFSLASTITQISIRGVSSLFGASTVGLYIDDTPIQGRLSPLGNVGSPYPEVFDLNRVEVARGPQGTLFGAGAEGGTVRFISNEPSLTQFSGFTHAEVASTQNGGLSYEEGAAAGGPIIDDKFGFRVSVWDRHDGGYVDRIDPQGNTVDRNANTDDKLVLRAALAFQVNDNVRITPAVFYQLIDRGNSGLFYATFSDPSTGHFNNGRLLPDAVIDHFVIPSIKVEAHLPFAELTFTASNIFRNLNESVDLSTLLGAFGVANYGNPLGPAYPTSPVDVAPTYTGQMIRGFTEELRLASNQPDNFLTWVAGLFNDHRTYTDYQTSYSKLADPTGANFFQIHQVITDDQIAAFAQGDFHITEKWTATLGARVAVIKTDLYERNGTGLLNAGAPPVSSGSTRATPVTPKVGLSYQADSKNLFYISAFKGFRAGGINTALAGICNATEPNSFSSDTVWSYEVGAKNQLFDGKLQIDSSVFRIDWSKIQQVVLLPCGQAYAENAGRAVSKGFDLGVQGLVTDHLRVNLDIAYTDAYFTESVFNDSGQPIVLKGDAIGFMPFMTSPWNANASANYEIPLPQGDKIHLRGEYQYHSRNPGPFISQVPTSPSYYPLEVPDPPTHLANAKVGYTRGKLDITLFVNNVFNSHPLLGSYQDGPTSNLLTYGTFRPRTVGLSANYEF
jgi:outer membrane receptor protein involved in Fe transport